MKFKQFAYNFKANGVLLPNNLSLNTEIVNSTNGITTIKGIGVHAPFGSTFSINGTQVTMNKTKYFELYDVIDIKNFKMVSADWALVDVKYE